ncbi:MAG: penicillin acylase family protein [Saprospiraceae bacterium]
MRYFRLLLSAAVLAGLIWSLQQPIPVGEKKFLPPAGQFFNPFSGFWRNAEPVGSNAWSGTDVRLPGLKGKVEVVLDDLMVPHIFAQTLEDAVMVQGYLTAKDRLWQMDIATRKVSGRLSEVLGERTLRIDSMNRRNGLGWAAERDLESWKNDPTGMALLDAYTAGVNAHINALKPADYPIEFKILNYAPEPWSPLKTAFMVENMAETLCKREYDLSATQTRDLLGQETYDALFPDWNPLQQPVVPDIGQWRGVQATAAKPMPDTVRGALGLRQQPRTRTSHDEYIDGSNNWALSGMRTQTGKPMLANDPHLNLTLPSIWYQVQIHTPDMNAYGVTVPGVPGIVIGFNEDMAWGVTNVSHDVADWYRIQWTDASKTAYRFDGGVKQVTYRVETIAVKNQLPRVDSVRYTVWGPVVHEHDEGHPLRDYAYRWLVHDPSDPAYIKVFLGLCAGKNWDDYRSSLKAYDTPAQNFVMATRKGNIAIQVQGRYPLRARNQGKYLQDGSSSSHAWQGFIPQEQVPYLKDPERGFVYSANQHSTPPSYPYYYHGEFEDFRGRRIFDRLNHMQGASLDSMAAMQLDNFSQRAADALPAMLRLLNTESLDPVGRQYADALRAWDCRYEASFKAPVFFELWYDYLYDTTWDELETNAAYPLQTPEAWRFIEMLQKDTLNAFFDHPGTPEKETARQVVQESFSAMCAYMLQHPQEALSDWGHYRPVDIKHVGFIDGFGRTLTQVGGHPSAPNAQRDVNGPSWRMVVSLQDSVFARGVYPGGQSGNPGSPHYDNMVDTWAAGKYYDLLFLNSATATDGRIHGRMTFEP